MLYKITFNGRTVPPFETFATAYEAWKEAHRTMNALRNNLTLIEIKCDPGIPSEECGLLQDSFTVRSLDTGVKNVYRIESVADESRALREYERDNALLLKPQPKGVKIDGMDV